MPISWENSLPLLRVSPVRALKARTASLTDTQNKSRRALEGISSFIISKDIPETAINDKSSKKSI